MSTFDLPVLREVAALISDVIDFEGTSLEVRFIVKRGIDEEVPSSWDL
jgi:hypothetical protein